MSTAARSTSGLERSIPIVQFSSGLSGSFARCAGLDEAGQSEVSYWMDVEEALTDALGG